MNSVLFVCTHNSIRSPMAAALARQIAPHMRVESVGVHHGNVDGLMIASLAEIGIDMANYEPKTIEDVKDTQFDTIIALSQEAQAWAQEWHTHHACALHFWPIADPSQGEGSRAQRLLDYAAVRDDVRAKIAAFFATGQTL